MAKKTYRSSSGRRDPSSDTDPDKGQNASEADTERENRAAKYGGGEETITPTADAEWMATVRQALANTPIIDTARVETIRSAIRDGRYTVDARHVAAKILRLERDL